MGSDPRKDRVEPVPGRLPPAEARCRSRSAVLIGALVELHRRGRFPFDRLVRFYELADIDRALDDSRRGEVLKPVLRMKH